MLSDKIFFGHIDESKHLTCRHILKTVVKAEEEKLKCLCFSSLPVLRRAAPFWSCFAQHFIALIYICLRHGIYSCIAKSLQIHCYVWEHIGIWNLILFENYFHENYKTKWATDVTILSNECPGLSCEDFFLRNHSILGRKTS